MANYLKFEKKRLIVGLLTEGASLRSTSRLAGTHRDTVGRLLLRVGAYCRGLLDKHVRGVRARAIECDEYWTFVLKKQHRLTEAERLLGLHGDWWVYAALDCDSRLVVSHLVGQRDADTAKKFMADVRARVVGKPEVYTDGMEAYVDAIEEAFGDDVACHAQLIKSMSGRKLESLKTRVIKGSPSKSITTSYVERHNLTSRTNCKRFCRKTNAHSKRLKHLKAAVALHYAYYNFVRVHSTLRVTPAMAAGITDRVWDLDELLAGEDQAFKKAA